MTCLYLGSSSGFGEMPPPRKRGGNLYGMVCRFFASEEFVPHPGSEGGGRVGPELCSLKCELPAGAGP